MHYYLLNIAHKLMPTIESVGKLCYTMLVIGFFNFFFARLKSLNEVINLINFNGNYSFIKRLIVNVADSNFVFNIYVNLNNIFGFKGVSHG